MFEDVAEASEGIRLIAVDWSGSKEKKTQRDTIWIADWRAGTFSLTSGRTREETCKEILMKAQGDERLIVGFDFAFSFPSDFIRQLGCKSVYEVWERVEQAGPEWLGGAWPDEFWVVKGRPKPPFFVDKSRREFRQTELGCNARSIFNLGAGAVGRGSITGQPLLRKLREEGLSVWSFDPPGHWLAIEIYPRLFTGRTIVSDERSRALHLTGNSYENVPEEVLLIATHNEHAFDALCSVVGMRDNLTDLIHLQQTIDNEELLEGRIWLPRTRQRPTEILRRQPSASDQSRALRYAI